MTQELASMVEGSGAVSQAAGQGPPETRSARRHAHAADAAERPRRTGRLQDFMGRALVPYQHVVLEGLLGREARHIVFIRDTPGHDGTAGFAEWLMYRNIAEYIPPLHSLREVMQAVRRTAAERCGAFVIDVPHCVHAKDGAFWASMESFQDGTCLESRPRWTKRGQTRPGIVVVGHRFPPRAHISVHRWELYDLAEAGGPESTTIEKLTVAQAEERAKLEQDGGETNMPPTEGWAAEAQTIGALLDACPSSQEGAMRDRVYTSKEASEFYSQFASSSDGEPSQRGQTAAATPGASAWRAGIYQKAAEHIGYADLLERNLSPAAQDELEKWLQENTRFTRETASEEVAKDIGLVKMLQNILPEDLFAEMVALHDGASDRDPVAHFADITGALDKLLGTPTAPPSAKSEPTPAPSSRKAHDITPEKLKPRGKSASGAKAGKFRKLTPDPSCPIDLDPAPWECKTAGASSRGCDYAGCVSQSPAMTVASSPPLSGGGAQAP